MNDQQLVAALRGLDRPVEPEREFADALFEQLRRQAFPHASRPMPRNLPLVAALLAAAALGVGLAAGARIFDDPLVEATTQPSPSPTGPPYLVEVPPGIVTISAPEAVVAVVREIEIGRFGLTTPVDRFVMVSWHPADTEYPTPDGGAISSNAPFWAVTAETPSGTMIFLVADASLAIVGTDGPRGPATPEPTLTVLPTRDPGVPLRLLGPGGLVLEPDVLPVPGAADRPQLGPILAVGDVVWALSMPVYTDGPMRLIRIDGSTNQITSIDLPDDVRFGSLLAGVGRLWLSTETELLALDASTGAIVDRFDVQGSVTGQTPDGVWLRTVSTGEVAVGGAVVVDPSTGAEIRRVTSPEGPGQAYVGLWQPPAFGSLWDVDRNTGLLHRLDALTGDTTATVDLGEDLAASCGADFGPIGDVPGFGDVVGGLCSTGLVLVDVTSNAVVGTLPGPGIAVGNAWWSLRTPESTGPGWAAPGSVVRSRLPGGSEDLALTFDLERHGGRFLAVADEALWILVAERGDENQDYEHNAAILRIPIADLPP